MKSLVLLFAYYGLEVFDVERGERYGGNIYARMSRAKTAIRLRRRSGNCLRSRSACRLHTPKCGTTSVRVHANRDKFMQFVYRVRVRATLGRQFLSRSRGHFAELLRCYADLMPYIGELPTSLKLGHYLPGKHPIVNNRRIVEEQPDYPVLRVAL